VLSNDTDAFTAVVIYDKNVAPYMTLLLRIKFAEFCKQPVETKLDEALE